MYQNGWRGSEGTNFQLSFDSCLHEIPLKLLTYILYYIEVSFLLTVYSWVILGVVLTISVFYLIIYVIVYLNLGRSFYWFSFAPSFFHLFLLSCYVLRYLTLQCPSLKPIKFLVYSMFYWSLGITIDVLNFSQSI